MPARLVIIVDSREQRPFEFPGIATRVAKLDVGDYSVSGCRSAVTVERKSFDDFFQTFTRRREQILAQLGRMAGYDVAALVVEASVTRIARGHKRTDVSGRALLATAITACSRAGVAPLFCGSRQEAQLVTRLILERYWNDRKSSKRSGLDGSFDARSTRVYNSD
jgi:ERCC4-type nuclease